MYFINLAQLEHSLQERNLGPLKRWKSWVSKNNPKNFQSKLTLAKTFLTLVILEKEKLNIGNCITSLCRSRCVLSTLEEEDSMLGKYKIINCIGW